MRRGRIVIYLVLILIIAIGSVFLYLRSRKPSSRTVATPTPLVRLVEIVIAGQKIPTGTQITEDMLSTMQIYEDQAVDVLFRDKAKVVGLYAKYTIDHGVPLTSTQLSVTPVIPIEGRNPYIARIPSGMTAIAIPITRLSSVAFGPRDGDRVNIIVTFLLVDVDAAYQSLLPNVTSGVLAANGRSLLIGGGTQEKPEGTLSTADLLLNIAAQSVSGGQSLAPQGRVEYDPNLQAPFYIVPSELQRARLVTQMIMQDIQVLKVGTFKLASEEQRDQANALQIGQTPTPAPQSQQTAQQTATITIERPDMITLVVTPKDAITLTYLLYSGAQFTLTMRGEDDTSRMDTEAVTLQYLLSQYNIPVPAKLPYSMEPHINQLTEPSLPNDTISLPPQQ